MPTMHTVHAVRPSACVLLGCRSKRSTMLVKSCHAQGGHTNPFLAGRALWCAAKLQPLMSSGQLDVFLQASCAGVTVL